MKAFNNFVKSVKRLFTNTKAAVKQEIAETKEVIKLSHQRVTEHPTVVICGGAPIPNRILNQRQRRKLNRQK